MAKNLIEKVGRVCKFDEKKDYQKVESGLAVSLSDALKTGIVKESSTALESNGIDDPEKVVGMVKNRFDAIEAERAIRKYGKKAEVSQYTTQADAPKVSE
jgi:hypothetical protein